MVGSQEGRQGRTERCDLRPVHKVCNHGEALGADIRRVSVRVELGDHLVHVLASWTQCNIVILEAWRRHPADANPMLWRLGRHATSAVSGEALQDAPPGCYAGRKAG